MGHEADAWSVTRPTTPVDDWEAVLDFSLDLPSYDVFETTALPDSDRLDIPLNMPVTVGLHPQACQIADDIPTLTACHAVRLPSYYPPSKDGGLQSSGVCTPDATGIQADTAIQDTVAVSSVEDARHSAPGLVDGLSERQLMLRLRRERNRAAARRSNAKVKAVRDALVRDVGNGRVRVQALREREVRLRAENLQLRKKVLGN